MKMNLTEGLADFIVNADSAEIGGHGIIKTKKIITDTVAVILSGAGSEVAPPMLRHAANMGGGDLPVLGTATKASPSLAALIHGTFGAALDFDDVLSMIPGHPAAVIFPALLTPALRQGGFSGAQIIDAYVIGLEAGTRLSQAVGWQHYFTKKFHSTGTLCNFCAVGALARLYRLSAGDIKMALGLIASTSSGLQANYGTMTKPFHSGWAAQAAVVAVDLVRSGFTAADDVLDSDGGFLLAYGNDDGDPARALESLGKPWAVNEPGVSLKKFPTCFATHRAIDAIHQIAAQVGGLKDRVAKVVCRVAPGGLMPLKYTRPKTGLEGKFSMQYNIAAAIIDDVIRINTFSDQAVQRPEILALLDKIEVFEDEACGAEDPDYLKKSCATRGFIEVEVVMSNGHKESCKVYFAPGNPKRELTWEDLHSKFIDCAESCQIEPQTAKGVFEQLMDFEKLDDVGEVIKKLTFA